MDKIEFQPNFNRTKLTIGIDEVNYSPSAAGDCVVCACWLPLDSLIEGIDDSKRLTHKKRLELFAKINEIGSYSIQLATPNDIAVLGIYEARNSAAELAIIELNRKLCIQTGREAELILVETSMKKLSIKYLQIQVIRNGDQLSYLIGAASIVAKVYIDALFEGYDKFWPGYNLSSNHGSVRSIHKQGLKELGPSPIHRTRNYASNWWAKLLNQN